MQEKIDKVREEYKRLGSVEEIGDLNGRVGRSRLFRRKQLGSEVPEDRNPNDSGDHLSETGLLLLRPLGPSPAAAATAAFHNRSSRRRCHGVKRGRWWVDGSEAKAWWDIFYILFLFISNLRRCRWERRPRNKSLEIVEGNPLLLPFFFSFFLNYYYYILRVFFYKIIPNCYTFFFFSFWIESNRWPY